MPPTRSPLDRSAGEGMAPDLLGILVEGITRTGLILDAARALSRGLTQGMDCVIVRVHCYPKTRTVRPRLGRRYFFGALA